MKVLRSLLAVFLLLLLGSGAAISAAPRLLNPPRTYCNPMNLDYAFILQKGPPACPLHRSTADPVGILYKGINYLFATNQEGYWWSKDMGSWHFVPHHFKLNGSSDQVCAPAAWPTDKGVLFLPCFSPNDVMPLYLSKEPRGGHWLEATESFPLKTWDPSIFQDDDGKLYVYWGSSNVYPIYGAEIDPNDGYKPKGPVKELLHLDPKQHGWEQFGENNQNGKMDPFIEGAWMNKFGGKYYLQYGAPGTEWNVYGDGVYVSDKPLGPFVYQKHNPFSWKPTGFACGAGHGSTFPDRFGNLWHLGTMVISVKDTFERRIGIFPAGVDEDGVLFADTAFGDYPHKLAGGKRDPHGTFAAWYLLSYNKKAWASSSKPGNEPALAVDENIKTYWSAVDAKPGQFLAIDLGKEMNLRAIQINYADEDVAVYGKQHNVRHRYRIYRSDDGKNWNCLVDKSRNSTDVPHDYVELSQPAKLRYVKLENLEMPAGTFAVSDFRIFGNAPGEAPGKVESFTVNRDEKDRRNLSLHWQAVPGAYAYAISFGVDPSKLYSSLLVYNADKYDLHSLNVDSRYYFKIQAVSESGISPDSAVVSD